MKNDALIRRFSCFSRFPPGATLALVLALAGCAVGPDYVRPDIAVPARYKAATNDSAGGSNLGDWKPAQPADGQPLGHWWERFGDAHLSALAGQVDISNQNVRAAQARFRQAQEALAQTRAARFPTLDGNASTTRGQSALSGDGGAQQATAGFPSPAKRRACLRVGRKGQPASGPCGQFQQVEDPLLGRQ